MYMYSWKSWEKAEKMFDLKKYRIATKKCYYDKCENNTCLDVYQMNKLPRMCQI